MASGICQNQFLGSRISLISKSEIRYEGILYALDLCEATISLAKVCSFGTEDRPTDRPIPAKDDIFEYIIFRGSDIKVIDVVEPPKQAANPGMPGVPADPAIVDFSHSNGNGHYGNHFDGGRMRPNNNSRSGGGPGMYNGGGPGGPNGGRMRRRSGGYTDIVIQRGVNQHGRNNMGGGGGGPQGRPQYGPPDGRNNFGGYVNYRQGGYNPNNGGQFQQRGRMTTPNRVGNFGQPRRGRPQSNGGNRTPFRNRGMNQAAFPPIVAFDGDYDFEKANEELLSSLAKAKLDDDTTENKTDDEGQQAVAKDGENKEIENNEPRTFYKKDDFFDNISCEALERSKGNVPRVDWKAERKLNAETFGLNPNNSNAGGNTRINRRGMGNGQRMMGGNMTRGPGGPGNWMMMPPQNYFRGGNFNNHHNNNNNRRQRIK